MYITIEDFRAPLCMQYICSVLNKLFLVITKWI